MFLWIPLSSAHESSPPPIARNEIYLLNHSAYYNRRNRILEDSLAHEFARYLQVHYFKADFTDPSCEIDAVAVQERFKDVHLVSVVAAARW